MALELATAIIRARFDTADLKKQTAAARSIIQKGLAGIRIRVKVDVDMASAKAAGARAGKAARQSASTAFTMEARRMAGSASLPVLGAPGSRALALRRSGMSVQMGPKPPPIRNVVVHPHRLGYSPPQQRRIGGPVYEMPQGSYSTRPSGGGSRQPWPAGPGNRYYPPGPSSPIDSWRGRIYRGMWGGGGGGGGGFKGGGDGYQWGGGGGGGGPTPFKPPKMGGREPGYTPRATGNMPRFSGGKAFMLGAGFQMAPNVTTAAAFGGAPGLAGAAVGAGIMAGTKAYMDFEKPMEMTKILQRQAGATDEQLVKLESRARSLGRTMVYSATEAAGAMETLTKGGMDADTVYESLPHVMNMAAAGGMENLSSAADITIAAMAQFNLTSADSARIADTLTTAANASLTSVENLGTALSYTGRTAKDSGLSIEEAAAAIATLSQGGIDSSKAGTAFRQMTIDMNKAKSREQFGKIGIKTLGRSPIDVAREAAPKLASMSDDAKDDFLSNAGFRGNVLEGFRALISGLEFYDDTLRKMANDTGNASRTAQERMKSMWATWKQVSDSFAELGISVTQLLHPMIVGLANAVKTLTDALSWMARQSKDVTEMLPESVRKIMGSILRVGSAAVIGGIGTGLMGLPPILGAAILGGAAAANETGLFNRASEESPTGSGGANPMGDKTDGGGGGEGGLFGGGGGNHKGGSLVDTKSIWSHIQLGLNGGSAVDKIEKNTAEIAKNTKPKTIAGEKIAAAMPHGMSGVASAVTGVASAFHVDRKPIISSGSIPVGSGGFNSSTRNLTRSELARANDFSAPFSKEAFGKNLPIGNIGIPAMPPAGAPLPPGVGVATGPFSNDAEGRKQRQEFLLNARRVRRMGKSGTLAFRQGKAKIAADERRAAMYPDGAPKNNRTPLEEGDRRKALGQDYMARAQSLDRQAAEAQERYDAMSPEEKYGVQQPDGSFVSPTNGRPYNKQYRPSGETLKKQIDALRSAAEKNRELGRMGFSNRMGSYMDATPEEVDAQKRRYRAGGGGGAPDQFFKGRAAAKQAQESRRQANIAAIAKRRMARKNPALRQAELDRETELSRESGDALRNRARGLEDTARPRYQVTESDQVNSSARQRMQMHDEFLKDPNGLKAGRYQSTDDQFTDWIIRNNKTTSEIGSLGGKQEKVVDDIEENTGETVDVLKRMEEQFKSMSFGGTWR